MATYSPPTRAAFRGEVAADLRDPALDTFLPTELDDFINEGIAELNAVKPIEIWEDHPLVVDDGAGNITVDVGSYRTDLVYVFNLELHVPDSIAVVQIPPNANDLEPLGRNGWDFFAGYIGVGIFWGRVVLGYAARYPDSPIHLRAWGYGVRDPLTTDAQVAEFDLEDEHFVRVYCRLRGFERLVADRSLYQQWQTQANNSDVSPTQLNGMEGAADAELHRLRQRMYVVRRPIMSATG